MAKHIYLYMLNVYINLMNNNNYIYSLYIWLYIPKIGRERKTIFSTEGKKRRKRGENGKK